MGKREEELGKFGLGSNLMLSEKEKRQLKEELAASEQAAADQRSFALKLLKVEQEKQAKLWEGKEIMPFGYNILVVPTDENPYLKKISDSARRPRICFCVRFTVRSSLYPSCLAKYLMKNRLMLKLLFISFIMTGIEKKATVEGSNAIAAVL